MRRCGPVVLVATTALFAVARVSLGAGDDGSPSSATGLAVPYVAQTEALCGGAAVSMVAHYWGHRDIHAADFAPLINEQLHGIRVDDLTQAVERRGWSAWAFPGDRALVTHHLGRHRPVIALLELRPGRLHYVVVVAWHHAGVVVHDPARGPSRVIPHERFEGAWRATGHLTLLLLPRETVRPVAPPRPLAFSSVCGDFVAQAIRSARADDLDRAEAALERAIAACPEAAVPIRELAGLRLRQSRWADASRLAEQAALLDPADRHAWRTLAAGRFLAGDPRRALDAWNAVDEPRVDLIDIQGLTRTRADIITRVIDLSPRDLLVDEQLRHARRRLAAVPSVTSTRVAYRPSAPGHADVEARVQERPLILDGVGDAGWTIGQALVEQHGKLAVSSPTGGGEVWSADWRWQTHRPRVGVSLAAPQLSSLGGLWTLDAFWERHSFGSRLSSDPRPVDRETRQRVSLRVSDWITPDVRWSVGAGLDQWRGRGRHLSLDLKIDARGAGDRAAIHAESSVWVPLGDEPGFTSSSVTAGWRGSTVLPGTTVRTRVGFHGLSGTPTLSVWLRPDTGWGGHTLLRAHPVLRDGIVRRDQLGRALVGGTVEAERAVGRIGPVGTGLAVFADVARMWGAAMPSAEAALGHRVQVDVGVGLRFDVLGEDQQLGLNLARGLRHGGTVVSVGWLPWE